jgi:hypothetical protein
MVFFKKLGNFFIDFFANGCLDLIEYYLFSGLINSLNLWNSHLNHIFGEYFYRMVYVEKGK